ncbi:MAG: NUDIX hydrolase [Acidobacteria bacterium]|nr:NUDIX hydrolase [Acidobacteriota bacterium]
MTLRDSLFYALSLVLLLATAAPAVAAGDWSPTQRRQVLEKTLTVRLDPDLSALGPGERAALDELLTAGAIVQRLYEDARHAQAALVRASLAQPTADPELVTLYRLFQGPIATTLDNERVPFLTVNPERPGKNVYPTDAGKAEIDAFLAAHPESRGEILGERTVVRRATRANLDADLTSLMRYAVIDGLNPGLRGRLRALAEKPDPRVFYAVPYSVAWADEHVALMAALFRAADAVEVEDAEFARYLRNRGRDFLSNDYESGDAAWVTGRFRHLNAQLGAYETYDDALYGVKAFPSLSLLVRDEAATAELAATLGGLQAVEDALPYSPHKRVRSDIPVGVYGVVADFGQSRGTNTATILPNDPLFSARYGRTILLRDNIMTNPYLFEISKKRWDAAVAAAHAGDLDAKGGSRRTLWHEVGHYLGPDRAPDGRPLDQALEGWADALEEMKSDLVSLFSIDRFHSEGTLDDAALRSAQASGVLRTLQDNRPRRDQPYQTMQLAQFNWFLEHGLLAADADARLTIDYERYAEVVSSLLREVLAVQASGDPARAAAFFERWTAWRDDLHEQLATRMREAGGPRYRLVRYAALGE